MILGNGEIQRNTSNTTITIEIPHKNLKDDEGLEVLVYVKCSLINIRDVIEPLLGHSMSITQNKTATSISFTKPNEDYAMREILRFIGNGVHHSTMTMNDELFNMTTDQKKELLRGVADVTGYIRKSNLAFGEEGHHRVYIEIPGNWQFVIDIANMLKKLDIPVQTIDFGHPNFRDSNLKKYNQKKPNYWKKEHQVKIWANEFLPIGFNIVHKQRALERYSDELLEYLDEEKTHKFYWQKTIRLKNKPIHPMENDISLPEKIRGKHFDSWTQLAKELGYGE
ncbi:hypothetical protein [Aliarcobacter cryaerophilus]|uniref:hypothetical protein n=1 Tax=Aliarcobacter cryaerophilus TaxID=28198 RepID=UPI003DA28516